MTPFGRILVTLILAGWCLPTGKLCAQEFANLDSLDGWYIPYDSAHYNVNKHIPSMMHFMKDGKYEAFGIAEKGKQWMFKGSWRRSNDSIFYYYDWCFDETIHAKYLATLVEGVPYRDTLVHFRGKYRYADPYAGIPAFTLIKIDWDAKDHFPVTEAVQKLFSTYKKEILHPAKMNEKKLHGIYSWQGDAGQTTLKLKSSGKYMMYRGEMKMTQWQKGRWELAGDTLKLKMSYARMYFVQDAVPVRERKFLVTSEGLTELKNQDVTAERHLYFMHRKFYCTFRHRFHRSLHG